MMMKELIIPLATGLFIFIFGMHIMRIGFENLFLGKIQRLLQLLTRSPLTGMITGTVATAFLQSSSAVMLLTIGLTHAKVIRFRDAIGIIMGANIGTVMTVELLTFDLYYIELYLFACGILLFLIPHLFFRCLGLVIGGFSLLFIGMETMQSITPILKTLGWVDSLYYFGGEGIFSGVVAGTIVTGLIQSSTATTIMTMNLVQDQIIPLTVAIAIALGSNIGTCLTAVLGSIGANLDARRSAAAHVLLNVGGVILFMPLISVLVVIVQELTTHPMQQVAHAQLIFNIACSLLVLPFVSYFEKAVNVIVPR